MIGLDVVRTDRALVHYENEENQARLWDILAVYSWIDKDIGYCQGKLAASDIEWKNAMYTITM